MLTDRPAETPPAETVSAEEMARAVEIAGSVVHFGGNVWPDNSLVARALLATRKELEQVTLELLATEGARAQLEVETLETESLRARLGEVEAQLAQTLTALGEAEARAEQAERERDFALRMDVKSTVEDNEGVCIVGRGKSRRKFKGDSRLDALRAALSAETPHTEEGNDSHSAE